MKTERHYIEHSNLSTAWALAVHTMMERGGPSEIAPVVISITGFDNGVPEENTTIRTLLDEMLDRNEMQSCDTVANTIFPLSLWNPNAPRAQLFDRYRAVLPRIRKASTKNRHGLYFQRLIEGGAKEHSNQLDYVLNTYTARQGVRRSALQVAVFDPKIDHSPAAQRGFPCLQHVTFAPTEEGLSINAFYATQYAFERAYGNYLGICRLGHFVAHELNLPLVRMTCFTGILLRDDSIKLSELKPMVTAMKPLLQAEGEL